jgi:hypothetical protein
MGSQVVPHLASHAMEHVPWFARPPVYSEEEVEMYPLVTAEPLNLMVKSRKGAEATLLPRDPRRWSRAEVCRWVERTCSQHGLPAPALDRFLMNGKAVCLMSPPMFTARVPLGGKLLYRDFQIRLATAVSGSA